MPNTLMRMTHIYLILTISDSNAVDVGSVSSTPPQAAGASEFIRNPAMDHWSRFTVLVQKSFEKSFYFLSPSTESNKER